MLINAQNQTHHNEVKRAIALAIQQAVRDITRSDGYRRCQLEASAGAIVASALTGVPFDFAAARTTVHIHSACGIRWWEFPTPVGHFRPIIRLAPEETVSWDIEHCFAISDNHIIDFSSWQYTDYFRRNYEVKWDFSPEYVWCPLTDIPLGSRQWYSLHWKADYTEDVAVMVREREREAVMAITCRALTALSQQGYQQSREHVLWPEWLKN